MSERNTVLAEKFYNKLEIFIKKVEPRDNGVVVGDFNVKTDLQL